MTLTAERLFPMSDDGWEPTSDDHYTPEWIFQAMGLEFDLDVAAPPGGIPWIPAKRYLTEADDGLVAPWEGLIWCNPPFTNVSPWARKFNEHPDGVMLAPTSKAAWLSESCQASDLIFVPRRTVNFIDPEGQDTSVFVMTLLFARGRGVVGLERLAQAVEGAVLTPREE